LKAATKYTFEMQAKNDSGSLSKMTKTTASTKKYAAVKKDSTVTKQTVVGQVTLGWKDSTTAATPTADSYDVGIWVGKVAGFNKSEFDEAVKLLKGATAIKNANAIWEQVGLQLKTIDAPSLQITFYGVSLKCTYAVRATATVADTAVHSAVAKIAVTPLKYPAPAKVTQSAPGTMSFTWVAPNLKSNKLPDVSPSEATSITYTIGLYDTRQKTFTGTTATTLIENLPVATLTTDDLTGVVKGNTVGVQQVITFANGNVVVSAVKTLKVK
jgi:hypothetical protein